MEFTEQTIVLGATWYLVFLFSVTCHEAAHALAAKLGGDMTAFEGGQVTLNPFPHIQREPFGTVIVPIASFALQGWMIGWASAPYDPRWADAHPRRAAWMAMAGPAANFALMLLAVAGIRGGVMLGHFRAPESAGFTSVTEAVSPESLGLAATFLSILFTLNLLLATFNLLPVPPLDGHSGVTLLMPLDAARRFLDWFRESPFAIAGLLVAWVVYGKIFRFIFPLAMRLLYPDLRYG